MRLLSAVALCALGGCATPAPREGPPRFVDATGSAGVAVVQLDLDEENCLFDCATERFTGGAAVGDVDGDGHDDLLLTRMDAPDVLLRNLGGGRFEDISEASGIASHLFDSNGAAFLDVDRDGDLDLYVTTLNGYVGSGRHLLFVNDGRGRFSEEGQARGAAVASETPRGGMSVAVGDYDRDGYVDLHVTEWWPNATRDNGLSHAVLLRNLGAANPGHFEEVTAGAGVALVSPGCEGEACRPLSFASAFADLDADGWPDLLVASDFGTSRLFWNAGDGTFVDGTAAANVGTDENGMGSTLGDHDNDGDLDWFVSSISGPAPPCPGCEWGTSGNRLFRNEGGRAFSDATTTAHVRDGLWGWGAAFFDADDDGDLDLTMTNGVVFPALAAADPDSVFREDPMRFWQNDGAGRFTERATEVGMHDRSAGKGLLVFDYDEDGDQDVLVVRHRQAPLLYRNDTNNGARRLRVRLEGTTSNTEGLGARVEVCATIAGERRCQVREMGSVSHFLGQSERVAHFGLWDARRADVRVTWPSGRVQEEHDVSPGEFRLRED